MTYNPAATISGHVAVHLQLLAKLAMEEDGVDSTESVSICQMLGTVLRVWEHSAPCMEKKKLPEMILPPHWMGELLVSISNLCVSYPDLQKSLLPGTPDYSVPYPSPLYPLLHRYWT